LLTSVGEEIKFRGTGYSFTEKSVSKLNWKIENNQPCWTWQTTCLIDHSRWKATLFMRSEKRRYYLMVIYQIKTVLAY